MICKSRPLTLHRFNFHKSFQNEECNELSIVPTHFVSYISAQFRSILTKGRKSERWLKIWFGPMPILGITDPALLQTIYSKEQYMEKPEYFYGTFGVDKSMISTSCESISPWSKSTWNFKINFFPDAEWKHVRKPFNQSFTKPMLANCISYFVECSTKLNESLAKFTDGSDFDILKYVSICTLDMLMESTYGIEKCQKTKDELYEKIVEAVDEWVLLEI